MPSISFPEYARQIENALNGVVETGEGVLLNLQVDSRSALRGFIVGSLQFNDRSELHFREFIDLTQDNERLMYAYHYQDGSSNLIFRYDNAAHKPSLEQPKHKHTAAGIGMSHGPSLSEVLDEIRDILA